MRSSRRIVTGLLVSGAVLATACREGAPPTAPAPSLAIGVGLQEGITSFMVRPGESRSYVMGDHKISFSANAICNPDISTYGPGEWDAPCEVVKTPIRITATAWTDEHGRPRIEFEPALRFHPDANVTLYLMDKAASADSMNAKILWVAPDGALIDESLTDPSVATYVGPNGFLYRRVKHFSGFTVSTSRSAEWY